MLEPPLDDDFAFSEEPDCLLTLPVQHAEEGIFHSAEGEERHWGNYAYVDADVAAFNPVLELASPFST
jgi:hypothetical protein